MIHPPPPSLVTIEGQLLSVRTVINMLHFSDAVSFRDIRGHLGTIYALVVEGDYSRITRRNPGE
jgi:hypothetical protein